MLPKLWSILKLTHIGYKVYMYITLYMYMYIHVQYMYYCPLFSRASKCLVYTFLHVCVFVDFFCFVCLLVSGLYLGTYTHSIYMSVCTSGAPWIIVCYTHVIQLYMWWLCKDHVLIIRGSCAHYVRIMCWSCDNHVLVM